MDPLCASTSFFVSASPRPVPSARRLSPGRRPRAGVGPARRSHYAALMSPVGPERSGIGASRGSPEPPTHEALREIARWLEERPWNRPGSDKSWVLSSMWESLVFHAQVRRSERVRDR